MKVMALARRDDAPAHPAITASPPCVRTLAEIQSDIRDTAARLACLKAERKAAWGQRDAGIIADFDAGMERFEIAARRGVTYAYANVILYRSGRKSRRAKWGA